MNLGGERHRNRRGFPDDNDQQLHGNEHPALTIDDTNGSSGTTYAMTSSTVSVAGDTVASFSGQSLTSLELDTAMAGSATVTVTGTPASAPATTINGGGGGNTINVLGTGTGSALFVSSGNTTNQASTVNVVADSEPVSISSFAALPQSRPSISARPVVQARWPASRGRSRS